MLLKNKKGFISIKWLGSSVSGLVVIAGIVALLLGQTSTGILFVILGLIGAILMTAVIRGLR
ncbi:hypothetical protein J4477_00745 [Candidatus Pacearchaeota archaeon]|nr:hypothetical protein [Candidatus Pacearchaeota archaeon]